MNISEIVDSLINEIGLDSFFGTIILFIIGLVIFSLKYLDKSEYEILLSNYLNKLLVNTSKTIPFYIIIFIIFVIGFSFDNKEIIAKDMLIISISIIALLLIGHVLLIQSVSVTDIKYDYFICIDGNSKKRIIKLINNEIMLLENKETKEIEFNTNWKNGKILKETANYGVFKKIYDERNYKTAGYVTSVLIIATIICILISIFISGLASKLIFIFLAVVLGFNIFNIWINILFIYLEKKLKDNQEEGNVID